MKQKLHLHSLIIAIVALAVLCVGCGQNSPSLDSRLFVLDLEEFPHSQSLVLLEEIDGPEDLYFPSQLRTDGTTPKGLENGVFAVYRNSILGGSVEIHILSFKNTEAARKAFALLSDPLEGGGDPDSGLLADTEHEVFNTQIGDESVIYDSQILIADTLSTVIRIVSRSGTIVVLVKSSGEDEVRGRAEPTETAYFAALASKIIAKVDAKVDSLSQ